MRLVNVILKVGVIGDNRRLIVSYIGTLPVSQDTNLASRWALASLIAGVPTGIRTPVDAARV